ncbi:Chromosome plasmid partitioning protein ParB [Moraxella catarrhalis]|uniref:ParB/RepB/Spo0J family partition protein n=1 Tax=Moraxella catarrhalis TaxID=480 RepID=UPI0007E2E531|nr:ParB/RepB/Spo0J family partition protein [Moraxella catarrhalis]OAV11102.1 Chromosome plasmid partitioning protein ParB [Moraxella catarrhalis]OAV13270.1 Chromosome plasmid partitioning protein ParB [Moraxella catarrhalis]OAV34063.1 Chromosome plasmid partitioning protein ParB [Moraxella catarrhalis]
MSKLAQQLKAKLAQNLEIHAAADKGFDGFDVYKTSRLETIAISDIRSNPVQPRTKFDAKALQELADNIDKNGLLQPITVRQTAQGYEIVAGERRFRAMQLLGKTSIECIMVHITDQQNALLALSENLARKDLSDYETALAVEKIQDSFDNKTELAKALGISRAKLYKLLSFNELPKSVLMNLSDNPSILSADTAEQIKTLKKDLNINDDLFGGILLKAVTMLKSGELKQSHLSNFIISNAAASVAADDCPNLDTSETGTTEVKALPISNVKKMYIREGKSVGKVKADGKKFVVELTAQALTVEQEEELMKFLDGLLGE